MVKVLGLGCIPARVGSSCAAAAPTEITPFWDRFEKLLLRVDMYVKRPGFVIGTSPPSKYGCGAALSLRQLPTSFSRCFPLSFASCSIVLHFDSSWLMYAIFQAVARSGNIESLMSVSGLKCGTESANRSVSTMFDRSARESWFGLFSFLSGGPPSPSFGPRRGL